MQNKDVHILMPKAAISFGLAGLIPFISMAALPYTFFEVKIPESALLAYGAIILSFLGGLLWGMALNGGDTIRIAPRLLTVGVITSLIGWGALLLPLTIGLLTLTLSFLALLVFDYTLYRAKHIPYWFLKLRVFLTLIVSLTLLIAALAEAFL